MFSGEEKLMSSEDKQFFKRCFLNIFLLVYGFMIPIYYQHSKASAIERGCGWNREDRHMCRFMSVIWPFSFVVECSVILEQKL